MYIKGCSAKKTTNNSRENKPLVNRQKVIESYNDIHSRTEKLLEMPSFYEWILDKLGVSPNNKFLDVATGAGSLIKCAQSRGVAAYGMDISAKALEKAASIVPASNLLLSDGEKLPFADASFDYVTNIGSLEHFIHPDIGVSEIHRVLKDSGKAAIFLPNSYYLGDILTSVLLKGKGPSHNQAIDRFAAKKEWAKLLEQNGLSVKKVYKYNFLFPRSRADWRYIKSRPKKIFGVILSPFIPFNLSYSFLYICEK